MRPFIVEMDKISKRKETYLFLLIFFTIPIFFSYQLNKDSGVVALHSNRASINIFELIDLYLGFITSLFLPFIAISGMTTSTLAREIEEGSIKLYLSHSKSRSSLFLAKFMSLAVTMLILYVLFCASGYLGSLLFDNKKVIFDYNAEAIRSLLQTFLYSYIVTIVLELIGLFSSLFVGVTGTYIVMLGLIFISKILELSNISKEYLLTFLCDSAKVKDSNEAIFTLCLYLLLFRILGLITFKKMDVKK